MEAEYAGGFFASDARKHDDLKHMLDSNKDGLKLEAMKRIIGMIAKGRDASGLFPAVVKNVVSQNIEVKKLVYVYLVRYAEDQQDLALLSISTFQRALKDPNQLIRASALRVLSSIRVSVIVPIMFLAIKDAVSDMSPYVRKTAAHAIPKLYSLDPEQKDALVEVIERLLADKTTLVVGSAVMAFEEVCPERIDLIHRNYRKLCNLLVDVEEWGQVEIILMLTRYARTQFTDPNLAEFQGQNGAAGDSYEQTLVEKADLIDPDLRLLLRNCRPLLQSRNSAVVMAVCQLYYHLAPSSEFNVTTKAMIRLLRSHREIQTVVLSNIATMSTTRKSMFEPYLKSFFIRTSDPTHIKLLKLEVLTNLGTEANISVVLREFQTYIQSTDTEFVKATIHCIGRCANSIKEVADTCLSGLTALLSSRNEIVVAESVVVIKKLLQIEPGQHGDIIKHMARLLDTIQVPMARASILWLIAEYAEPKIAPDVLRKVAKTFVQEEDIVKLQALNLASKLSLTNSQTQTKLIVQYLFNLAKYDQNYDIRDRVRFLRALSQGEGPLTKYAKKLLLAPKPAPKLQSQFEGRDQYQMGSLSHFINQAALGYQELPDFPDVAPDTSVRNVTPPPSPVIVAKEKKGGKKTGRDFYESQEENGSSSSESSTSSSESEGEDQDKNSKGSQDESADSSSASEDSESDSESSSSDDSEIIRKAKRLSISKSGGTTNGNSSMVKIISTEDDSSTEGEKFSRSSSESEVEVRKKTKKQQPPSKKTDIDLLLDFGDSASIPAPMALLQNMALSPSIATPPSKMERLLNPVTTAVCPSMTNIQLVSKNEWKGLEVFYRYTRSENIFSNKFTSVEMTFENRSDDVFQQIAVLDKKILSMEIKGVTSQIPLSPGATFVSTIGIDFNDSAQSAKIDLKCDESSFTVNLAPPIGEIIRPVITSQVDFEHFKKNLGGMCENSAVLKDVSLNKQEIKDKVYRCINTILVEGCDDEVMRFASQTMSSSALVLISAVRTDLDLKLTVNCEKMAVGQMLLSQIKDFTKS